MTAETTLDARQLADRLAALSERDEVTRSSAAADVDHDVQPHEDANECVAWRTDGERCGEYASRDGRHGHPSIDPLDDDERAELAELRKQQRREQPDGR